MLDRRTLLRGAAAVFGASLVPGAPALAVTPPFDILEAMDACIDACDDAKAIYMSKSQWDKIVAECVRVGHDLGDGGIINAAVPLKDHPEYSLAAYNDLPVYVGWFGDGDGTSEGMMFIETNGDPYMPDGTRHARKHVWFDNFDFAEPAVKEAMKTW